MRQQMQEIDYKMRDMAPLALRHRLRRNPLDDTDASIEPISGWTLIRATRSWRCSTAARRIEADVSEIKIPGGPTYVDIGGPRAIHRGR